MNPFDPHPDGCPIGLRLDPVEMNVFVREVWAKLRDVLKLGVFVVNPSKGDSYPLLFLSGNEQGAQRVVLFPAWEDTRRKRKVDFARQTTLLQRIREAGISPEPLESTHGLPSERLQGPLYVPLDTGPDGMSQVLHDAWERLGEYLRLTVLRVGPPGDELRIVRAYVLDDELEPRLVLYPGWTGDERPRDPRAVAQADTHARTARNLELPIEALFGA